VGKALKPPAFAFNEAQDKELRRLYGTAAPACLVLDATSASAGTLQLPVAIDEIRKNDGPSVGGA
jgi:hypothetical protein